MAPARLPGCPHRQCGRRLQAPLDGGPGSEPLLLLVLLPHHHLPGCQCGFRHRPADRTYDDGFVNQDAGTPIFGDTTFWGYNNASQLQGNTLSFNAVTGSTTTTVSSSSSSTSTRTSSSSRLSSGLGWNDDLEGSGWFAQIESPALFKLGPVALSLDLGYSFAGADSSQSTGGVFQARQESVQTRSTGAGVTSVRTRTGSVTDSYDVTGLIIPSAPYAGTNGGIGPLITNVPASRQNTNTNSVSFPLNSPASSSSSRSSALFLSNVHESFEVDLHTLSFGPRFSYEYKRVRLGLGLGFGLNIADWEADYQETLSVRQNGGKSRVLKRYHENSSGTEVLPGFYLEPSLQVRLFQRVSLFASGRYDWAESFSSRVGPSAFDFEAGGWSAMAGFTFSL